MTRRRTTRPADHMVRPTPRFEALATLLPRLRGTRLFARAREWVRAIAPLIPADEPLGGRALDCITSFLASDVVLTIGGTVEHPGTSRHPAVRLYALIAAEQALRAERRAVTIPTLLDFMHDPRPANRQQETAA